MMDFNILDFGDEFHSKLSNKLNSVLKSSYWSGGENIKNIEEKFSEIYSMNAISCSSGGMALEIIATVFKNIKKIGVQSNTYFASILPWINRNKEIVLIGTKDKALTPSLEFVKEVINKGVDAIVLTHIGGYPIPEIKEIVGDGHLKLLLHSIAFGTTTNFFGDRPVTQRQMDMTVHVMGNSLLYWTQKLFNQKLLSNGSRIIGLTSEGNYLAMEGYGPVSVAKVAMEAIIRQIGWELGEFGITANSIQAGITPTRALTKITDRWETWVENTKKRNPMRRTTTPNDVANAVKLLMEPEADFINCSIIYCDGGEHRSGSF